MRRVRYFSEDLTKFLGYGDVCTVCADIPNPDNVLACYCSPIKVRHDPSSFRYGPGMMYMGAK